MTSSSLFSSSAQRNLLYVGVALNAFTIFKHSQIGFLHVFPRLNAGLGAGTTTAFSARMIYLMFSNWCVGIALLQLKWAQHGLATGYDKALLAWFVASQVVFGVAYWMKGLYLPLLPLWAIPAVTVLSQVL